MSTSTPSAPHELENTVYGVDIGTARARVATIRNLEQDLRENVINLDIPSVVSFTSSSDIDDYFLDPPRCLVGSAAKVRIIPSAPNTFHATKYLLGRSYDDPLVQRLIEKNIGYTIFKSPDEHAWLVSTNYHQIFTPENIAALILLKLKELAENEEKIPIKNVVIAAPAYFTETQVQATREAAQMAGLNVLQMINEPTAVVLAYGSNQTNKTVVVYDFGGTFKVSVVEIKNGEPKVMSTAYDLFLGSDDFDNVLVNHIVEELKRLTEVDCSKDRNTMQWLKKAAEHAKIDLSAFTEIKINFYIIGLKQTPKRITLSLKRSEFEEMVAEFIDKTKPLCQKALDDAKVSISDIDEVFVVGGISMMPKVKATVEEIFGKAPSQNELCNRKEAVAVGAARTGRTLAADLTEDHFPSVEVLPLLPKPVKQTDVFNYKIVDNKDSSERKNMFETVCSTGIFAILTDEEADSTILRHHVNGVNGEEEDEAEDVEYIRSYQKILCARRRNTDAPLPGDLKQAFDFFRRGRDGIILEALCRAYRAIPSFSSFLP